MHKKKVSIEIGRELDQLIAEVVFGVKVDQVNQKGGHRIDKRAQDNKCNNPIIAMNMIDGWKLKSYSSDIADAWDVVEKLGRSGTQWRFSNKAHSNQYWWAYTEDACCQGDTLPHAICLAALKHIEEKAVKC